MRVALLLGVAVVPGKLVETQAKQHMLQEDVFGKRSQDRIGVEKLVCTHGTVMLTYSHLFFGVHHINSLQADPNVDSFAFSPLENPLRWFVNLPKEESTPVCS